MEALFYFGITIIAVILLYEVIAEYIDMKKRSYIKCAECKRPVKEKKALIEDRLKFCSISCVAASYYERGKPVDPLSP